MHTEKQAETGTPPPSRSPQKPGGRALKRQVGQLLDAPEFPPALEAICRIPPRRVINPLFSFLYHSRPLVRWRAVTAMGRVVCLQAEADLQAAQVIVRRLMWNLNDESGGIGWGSPEAMGEIMACSPALARNYHRILISYADPAGNFLEHPVLQQGVLWALGRLFHVRPELGAGSIDLLVPVLSSPDAAHRALAVRALTPLRVESARSLFEALCGDDTPMWIYSESTLGKTAVSALAGEALAKLDNVR